MGTARENKLRMKAYKIASHAYGLFAKGQGTGSLGLSQGDFRKLGKDKESIVEGLTNKYYERLLKAYPEDKWNNQEAMTLDRMKIEDVANTLIDEKNPANLKKKLEFSAYKDLIAPTEEGAKDWYQMDSEQIGKAMAERGFNPKNRNDVKQFFDKLSEHDINYNRGKIVEEDYEKAAPFEKLAMLAFPSLTDEAVKQSLTGEYDDGKMYRALGTDAVIGTAMGLVPGGLGLSKGVTAAGKAGWLATKNPGTTKLLNPLYTGLADAGLEGVRQGVDVAEGREFDPGDIATAGITAATVPFTVAGLRLYAKRGKTLLSAPFVKGLIQGAKGAENPLNVERNELKELLMNVRKASDKGMNTDITDGKLRKVRGGMKAIDDALLRDEAKQKLMALGLRSADDEAKLANAVDAAQIKYDNAKQALDQVIDSKGIIPDKLRDDMIKQHGRMTDKAQANLEAALAAQKDYMDSHALFFGNDRTKYPYVEDIIGGNPERGRHPLDGLSFGRPGEDFTPTIRRPRKPNAEKQIESVLTKYYDKPVKPNILTPTGQMDVSTANQYAGARKLLKDTFPEKAAAEGIATDKSKAKSLGYGIGAILGNYGTRIEPNIKFRNHKEKLESFKTSDWFKKLPKEKKNAIEKALKGED
jgi:hypothetical protein